MTNKRHLFSVRIMLSIVLMIILTSCAIEYASEQTPQPTAPTESVIESPVPTSIEAVKPPISDHSPQPTVETVDQAVQEEQSNIDEPEQITKLRKLPSGFVYLDEMIPSAQFDIRYYTDYNFVGSQIDGYTAPFAIGTVEMAEALVKVDKELEQLGYGLIIYDSYRPAKAVKQFIAWSKDKDDIKMKEQFYPNEEKSKLFQRGYLSSRSGHSRGSTIDLSLVYLETGEEVDMGSSYDVLDEISHFSTKQISVEQAANRKLLKLTMEKHGFKAYSKEWWHYVLKNEPYPNTYFDFDIE